MKFIDRYKQFKIDQGKLNDHKYKNVMIETIDFLLKNAIGIENSIATNKIIRHLESKGYKIKKETWQIKVLGPLRDNGIYIGSRRGNTGMFLISSKDDAVATRSAIYSRMIVEQKRMKKLEKLMDEMHWDYE